MTIRELKPLERTEATLVFGTSVDFSTVRIADDIGLQNRAWCSPPGWGALPYFCLHVGELHFNGNMKFSNPGLMIHEMTHAWQGQHNIPFWYVINSGCNQLLGGPDAYKVTSQTGQWKDYGAEQQASMVRSWYDGGMNSSDWRFRFIRDNIRKGDPNAFSQDAKDQAFRALTPDERYKALTSGSSFSRRTR
jgi:hypothetical protein